MSDPVDSDRNREHDLEPEWDPSVHRLPVWATIREAVQAIAKEWKALLQAIAVPVLVLAAGSVASQRNPEYLEAVLPNPFLQDILPALLSIVLLTLIAVSCHRLIILGADSLPNAWGLFWSWRETRFLGWMYGIWIIAMIPLVLLVLLIQALPLFTATPDEWLLLGILFPLALYVFARFSLVFPATAIGQRPTLKASWRLTRSNGWGPWRLSRSNGWGLAVLLSPAVLSTLYALLNESLVPPEIALHVLAAFTLVLMWVFGIALLSQAGCWLTAGIEPSTPS